jgi:mannose-1-phosphate guanylyltransferase
MRKCGRNQLKGNVVEMEHLNAVILAGGSGTRLWPLSTPSFPKQFLPLPNGRSMIQESLTRVEGLISPERAWVVTGRSMIELVREHLPSLPVSQILGEPMGRSTAAAIGWAAATIVRRDPQATMMVLTADHVITKVDVFNQALRLADRLARQGFLVTLGIQPTGPKTGYGYIRYDAELSEGFDHQAFYGKRFVEKPNVATAMSYLEDGHYVWNSGMFVWKVETILTEIKKHLPELAQKIDVIVESMGTARERETLDEVWPTLQTISIDYGVMEKASKFAVIPVEIGWNDVGNWEQYGSLFPAEQDEVRCVGHHVGLGSSNIFVYNNTQRQVYTIGLEDVVIVEMDDKTVICHKDEVQRVKELAESQLKKTK